MIKILDLSGYHEVFDGDFMSDIMCDVMHYRCELSIDDIELVNDSSIRELILFYWNHDEEQSIIDGLMEFYYTDYHVIFVDDHMKHIINTVFPQKGENPFTMVNPEEMIEVYRLGIL